MTDRRSFLAALAAPLISGPTLEDIERLTWRRKYWPGWRAPLPRHLYEVLRYGVIDIEFYPDHFGCFGDIVHETAAEIYAELCLSPEIQTGRLRCSGCV